MEVEKRGLQADSTAAAVAAAAAADDDGGKAEAVGSEQVQEPLKSEQAGATASPEEKSGPCGLPSGCAIL